MKFQSNQSHGISFKLSFATFSLFPSLSLLLLRMWINEVTALIEEKLVKTWTLQLLLKMVTSWRLWLKRNLFHDVCISALCHLKLIFKRETKKRTARHNDNDLERFLTVVFFIAAMLSRCHTWIAHKSSRSPFARQCATIIACDNDEHWIGCVSTAQAELSSTKCGGLLLKYYITLIYFTFLSSNINNRHILTHNTSGVHLFLRFCRMNNYELGNIQKQKSIKYLNEKLLLSSRHTVCFNDHEHDTNRNMHKTNTCVYHCADMIQH